MDIIKLLSEGKTVKEVAALTGINRRTLEKRLETMRQENQCVNMVQLIVKKMQAENDKIHAALMEEPKLMGVSVLKDGTFGASIKYVKK